MSKLRRNIRFIHRSSERMMQVLEEGPLDSFLRAFLWREAILHLKRTVELLELLEHYREPQRRKGWKSMVSGLISIGRKLRRR